MGSEDELGFVPTIDRSVVRLAVADNAGLDIGARVIVRGGFVVAGFDDAAQIDELAGRDAQVFAEIILESSDNDLDAATAEFAGNVAEIAVARDENDVIRLDLDGEFQEVSGHHYINVSLVCLLGGGAALLADDVEGFAFEPMKEALTFDSEFSPFGRSGGQARVDKHFEDVVIARELIAELEPIDGSIELAADPGEVSLIDKDQRSIESRCSLAPCRHARSSFGRIVAA